MIRYFAPYIIDTTGTVHTMSIAEQSAPGAEIRIYPYTREIHSTRFIAHRIRLSLTPTGLLTATPA